MGVAYKKDISDTRESPAKDVIKGLLDKNANVSYLDPFVQNLNINGKEITKIETESNLNDFDLIIIHTPHSEFKNINFENISSLIFDTTGSEFIKNAERI